MTDLYGLLIASQGDMGIRKHQKSHANFVSSVDTYFRTDSGIL